MSTYKDEIVDEVRKVRYAYAARFNHDLRKIFNDILKKEKEERGFRFVSRVGLIKKSKAAFSHHGCQSAIKK
jgi:hypothetical protein